MKALAQALAEILVQIRLPPQHFQFDTGRAERIPQILHPRLPALQVEIRELPRGCLDSFRSNRQKKRMFCCAHQLPRSERLDTLSGALGSTPPRMV
jgi:hypothetical protein